MTKIPVPAGRRYLPFQKDGIRFAAVRKHVLIADEMGLGKTIQAIGLMNINPTIRHVLVVCPATLRLNWAREIKRWSVTPRRIRILKTDSRRCSLVTIVNYDILHRVRWLLDRVKWDLLILDECHLAKNKRARRTKMIIGGQHKKEKFKPLKAKRKLFLSGTPILSRPVDLWPIVKVLDRKGLGQSFTQFAMRYCGATMNRYGTIDYKGSQNEEELGELLKPFMIRRLKKDVLKDLPPKRRQVIELPLTPATRKLVEDEMRIYQSHQEYIDSLIKRGKGLPVMDSRFKAKFPGLVDLFSMRHKLGLLKVPQIIDHIGDCLEQGPVVCFAHHRSVITKYQDAFKRQCVVLTGSEDLDERQRAVDKFQAGKADLFVGQLQAAGVGITLVRSSHVVFAELDWVPANLTQAEDRCHRIGQRDNVLVQHLVLEGSLDRHIVKTLIKKQRIIDKVLDGGE